MEDAPPRLQDYHLESDQYFPFKEPSNKKYFHRCR